jgi:acyl transferase domain-containing protein/NAD(P)-dependent dehydrogenase (short-subunit alcohol dehydrogenase family)/acyl carrier protein
MNTYSYPEERIAVVGMGGLFPDAGTVDIFWNNILQKKVSVREVPDSLFDKRVYYRPDVLGKPDKHDKTYTKVASMSRVEDYTALCRKYRIPPAVAQQMDPNQHAAIYCMDQALQSLRSSLPKERTAVILGTGAQGKIYTDIVKRTSYAKVRARLEEYLRNHSQMSPGELEKLLQELSDEALKGTIPVTEDSGPGTLQNITAARISNIFDFLGPSFTVDAACASTLAAVSTGIAGLLRHEYDALITGGMEVTLDETGLIIFSGINALSPDGSFPFDERANGFVIGLGGGILILKRLEDALRDQDQILALVSGYGQGSDGKGKYIAAPNEEGQVRVIQSACKMSGYSADTIDYIETHGTGTVVGDVVEVSALKKAFQNMGITRQNFCGLGSVKSNIGHLRYASGAASMIKVALALHQKTLPPTANIQKVNPKLQLEGSPFYILTDKKPWPEAISHPRRANVSTYGFGGADYHITMEEFRPEFLRKNYSLAEISAAAESAPVVNQTATVGTTVNLPEVVFFSGDSLDEVKQSYLKLVETQTKSSDNPPDYHTSVFFHNSAITAKKEWRVAISARSTAELAEKWPIFEKHAKKGKSGNTPELQRNGIYWGTGESVTPDKIAWMFPGQASQYPNMLKSIYENYAAAESFAVQVDAIWKARYGYPVTPLIFGATETAIEQELKNTKNTHPAMFLSNMAMYKLLTESGITADYMLGHSLGEITALYAAGMLDLKSAVSLVGDRGFSFDSIPEPERGLMVSVKAAHTEVNRMIKSEGLDLSIANINSPEQTVAGGRLEEINKFVAYLQLKKIGHTVLKVSHAFHTHLTQKAADSFYQKISAIPFGLPKVKVMACHRVDFYPGDREGLPEMPKVLREQIVSPVNFVDSVQKLYDLGVRVFIETGPSSILTNLVKSILKDTEIKIVTVNHKQQEALETLQQALAELFSYGMDICMPPSNQLLGLNENRPNTLVTASNHIMPETITRANMASTPVPPVAKESIVYSGVSMGLPGTFKKIFSEDNFKLLLEGKNLIELLTDDERKRLLDLNITRLVKTDGAATFKKLTALNEVIQLAGKFGKLDMLNDYQVDEKLLNQMTLAVCAGVAAGYEALKDAGIPLVREYTKTASGSLLPGRLALPEEMRAGTGIIYANGLFPIEMVIAEVSKYIAGKYGSKTRSDLIDFYEAVIAKVSDPAVKKLLSDWFAMHYSRLVYNGGEETVYEFNHHFMTLLSSQANNRLAQFIGATGPNFFISAACSSTTNAVTVAEDLIRAGHAERIIVIGADSASSKEALPWIGAGFLSIGAASDSANVFEAAVPFDNRRNGMILGSGAVGLVIEKESGVAQRGMNGICRILGTHAFNTAGHQSKIDSPQFGIELNKFLTKIEHDYPIQRRNIAATTVYYSHETYSAKKGGCSYTEKTALESAFGENFREIKVINTKGMTGHSMGASIEEAVAAKVLQYQQIPPIVNYKDPDPELEGLNLSQGGAYRCEYVLRMVSGFGGQGNYHLLQKIASGDERIPDRKAYQEWLEKITASQSSVTLKNYGRILVAEGEANYARPKHKPEPPAVASENSNITDMILTIYADVTKYPKEMLDLSMELEADLGVDTVKQATIFGMIAEKFNLSPEENLQLSNYPTIGHMVNLIHGKAQSSGKNYPAEIISGPSRPAPVDDADTVFQVISEITQYPVDMLDKAMEMEADLGIDTVKQATIFALLAQKYGIPEEHTVNVSQYKTIGSVIEFINDNRKNMPIPEINNPENVIHAAPQVSVTQPTRESSANPNIGTDTDIETQVLGVISEITQYPVEMLEKDMEMEADLGIDTVKQATIFAILTDKFGAGENPNLNISQYTTIDSIIRMIQNKFEAKSKSSPPVEEPGLEEITTPVPPLELGKVERELCLQIPAFAAEKLEPKDFDLKGKNLWILGDHRNIVQHVSGYFKKWSGKVAEFVFEDHPKISDLQAKIAVFVKSPVDVIVDCTHITESVDLDEISQNETGKMLFLNGEARFIFYKKLLENIPEPEIRIVCAISVDGCHGYAKSTRKIRDPFYGALSGFYKALGKEWPKSRVKIVDLGPLETGNPTDKLLSKIADELQASSLDNEIGYPGGKRSVFKIDYFDKTDFQAVTLPDNPHFLVTGGGYGITAEIITGLSKERKCKFTILGRTELPKDITELARLDDSGLEQKKLKIHDALKKTGKKITPLMVQTEFEKIVKAISIFNVIHQVERNGSEAWYVPCDVTDFDKLETTLTNTVAKNGPIHGLVHAAGIEKSRLLSQKTTGEFAEIFAAKAAGLCNLYRLINKEELKVLIGFSSISGRFGNEAQIDYSSANSFINSFMAVVRAMHKEIHALSIVWSGWKDTGIAWRNEFVKTHSEEMGIHLIEPERGTAEFVQLLDHRTGTSEIIISKGIHSFIEQRMLKEPLHETPLIDWVTKKDGKFAKAYKVLSVKRDPIINQHRLGATPLVPAVAFMEMCAELHSLNFGRKEQYCFRNIELQNPLKLHHEKAREVIMEIQPGALQESFEAVFYAFLDSKYDITKQIELNRMDISSTLGEYLPLLEIRQLENEPMEEGFTKQSIDEYHQKFQNAIQLGPLFIDEQKENNIYKRNKHGAVYSILLPEEELVNPKYRLDRLLINPAFTDSIFQACGVHTALGNDRVYLPWKVEEFGIVNVPRERCRYKVYAKLKSSRDGLKIYDVIMVNESNEVCYYAKNVTMRIINL